MNSDADRNYLKSIRDSSLGCLQDAIGPAQDVAIVDAPNQRNVGDSLIWAGELAYLRALGVRVRYVSDLWSFDASTLRKAMPSGVVLLHGGGNFGDLWIGHQIHREQVLKALRDYRIVQLPQSVQFNDLARVSIANTALRDHPDVHLLIRDSLSLEKANRYFPDTSVEFCPDMAFGWTPPSKRCVSEHGQILAIAREDHEGASGLSAVRSDWVDGGSIRRTDWTTWNGDSTSRMKWEVVRRSSKTYGLYVRGRRKYGLGLPTVVPNRLGAKALRMINELNISGAVGLYENSRVVVTDRLHAHVLASLLEIPHVVLDNSYGKVSTIYNDYSGAFSSAHYAATLNDAQREVERLVRL